MKGEELITASFVMIILLGIVAYFLKWIHKNSEDNIEQLKKEINTLDNRQTVTEQDVKGIQKEISASISHIEKTIDLKLKNVTDRLDLILIQLQKSSQND